MPSPFAPRVDPDPPVEVIEPDAVVGSATASVGPAAPVGTASVAPCMWKPPRMIPTDPGVLHLQGLHGGAGASTVQALLSGRLAVQDTHTAVPIAPNNPSPVVLFVARTHGAGLHAAQRAAATWAAGVVGIELIGLVLVDDAPRPSKRQVAEARKLTGMLPRLWRVPWAPEWREPGAIPTPAGVRGRRTVAAITEAARAAGVRAAGGPA